MRHILRVVSIAAVSFCILSCSYLLGSWEDEGFGLTVKVLSYDKKRLKLRLESSEQFADGFVSIVGSPKSMDVKGLEKGSPSYTAILDIEQDFEPPVIVLDILRGREKSTVDGQTRPAQWWNNTVKLTVNPENGEVVAVEFDGEVMPDTHP